MSSDVAIRIDEHYTVSTVVAPATNFAHVVYIGAVSSRPADGILGTPEAAIDLDAAGEVLRASAQVVEHAGSPANTLSPFGV